MVFEAAFKKLSTASIADAPSKLLQYNFEGRYFILTLCYAKFVFFSQSNKWVRQLRHYWQVPQHRELGQYYENNHTKDEASQKFLGPSIAFN
jgi:hypothetical protein